MLKISKKRVFLFGYYGRKNIGDDIMLNNIIYLLLKNNVEKITILSGGLLSIDSSLDRSKIEVLHGIKTNIFTIMKRLINSEFFVWGGGTCFFDNHSKRGLIEIDYFLRFRRLFGKSQNYFIGIGMEDLGSAKAFVDRIIFNTSGIIFRDPESLQRFKKFYPEKKLKVFELYSDLVFHDFTIRQLDNCGIGTVQKSLERYFTFSGHMKYGKTMAAHCAEQLIRIIKDNDVNIKLIPAKYGDYESDFHFHSLICEYISINYSELQERVHNIPVQNFCDFIDVLSNSQQHFGMRLHSLILSDIIGVPKVALSYQNKVIQYDENAWDPSKNWNRAILFKKPDFDVSKLIQNNTTQYEEVFR